MPARHEGGQLHPPRRHAQRGRRRLVVAHGDHGSSQSGAAQVVDQRRNDRQGQQTEPVVTALIGQVDARGGGAGGCSSEVVLPTTHQPVLPVEPALAGHREAQRGDGEEQAADAQRGKADEEGDDAAGDDGVDDRLPGRVPEFMDPAPHERADADERELPERDLAGEAGEHDDRQAHDGEHGDARQQHPLAARQGRGRRRPGGRWRGTRPLASTDPGGRHHAERAQSSGQRPGAGGTTANGLTEAAAGAGSRGSRRTAPPREVLLWGSSTR